MLLMMAAGPYMKGGTAASADEEDCVDGFAPRQRGLCGMTSCHYVADLVRKGMNKVVLIDSRSFLEYNTIHIAESINVYCSKIVKRRLQQDKVTVQELLAQACPMQIDQSYEIIVYDQCTQTVDPCMLTEDCFLYILLKKLVKVFRRVSLLKGGFLEFQATHPSLCESNSSSSLSSSGYKCPPLTSMSQPCLPVANVGPTKILPFLYLGSQHDALRQDIMQKNGINYLLNVSNCCPKPNFIQDSHFLRIPVSDNYNDKLLPFFYEAFQFLEKVRSANGCVLVHCLAGISRSPTLAIAYLMGYLGMSTDEAYKYVKDKRPTISPNFNFLGQLLEYENQLKAQKKLDCKDDGKISMFADIIDQPLASPSPSPKHTARPRMSLSLSTHRECVSVQSPTTALAKLNFHQTPETTPDTEMPFTGIPTSNLGNLSFTPCFATATAEAADTAGGVRLRVKRQGGVKRPYSTSTLENCLPSEFAKNFRDSNAGENLTAGTSVQPMAYSTLPSVDSLPSGVSEEKPSSLWAWIPPRDDETSPESMDCTTGSPSKQGSSTAQPPVVSPASPATFALQPPKRANIVRPSVLGGPIGSSRMSRSLENIIRCKDSELDADQPRLERRIHKQGGTHLGCVRVGPELITHPAAVESMQCQHCASADTHYQSSSSISSSGSHNSLHDTLEIIPVS